MPAKRTATVESPKSTKRQATIISSAAETVAVPVEKPADKRPETRPSTDAGSIVKIARPQVPTDVAADPKLKKKRAPKTATRVSKSLLEATQLAWDPTMLWNKLKTSREREAAINRLLSRVTLLGKYDNDDDAVALAEDLLAAATDIEATHSMCEYIRDNPITFVCRDMSDEHTKFIGRFGEVLVSNMLTYLGKTITDMVEENPAAFRAVMMLATLGRRTAFTAGCLYSRKSLIGKGLAEKVQQGNIQGLIEKCCLSMRADKFIAMLSNGAKDGPFHDLLPVTDDKLVDIVNAQDADGWLPVVRNDLHAIRVFARLLKHKEGRLDSATHHDVLSDPCFFATCCDLRDGFHQLSLRMCELIVNRAQGNLAKIAWDYLVLAVRSARTPEARADELKEHSESIQPLCVMIEKAVQEKEFVPKRLQEEIKCVATSDDAAVVSTAKGSNHKLDPTVAPKPAGPGNKIRRK